jgi:hypothetical protein
MPTQARRSLGHADKAVVSMRGQVAGECRRREAAAVVLNLQRNPHCVEVQPQANPGRMRVARGIARCGLGDPVDGGLRLRRQATFRRL